MSSAAGKLKEAGENFWFEGWGDWDEKTYERGVGNNWLEKNAGM